MNTLSIGDKRVVFLGDAHFGARSDSQVFHNRFELFYNFLFEYMRANNLKTIIQFGDLFDRRKYINFGTLSKSREYFFDKMQEYGFDFYALIGNHDIPYKNTLEGNSPSLLLQDYSNITLIQEPTTIKINSIEALAIPWICDDNFDVCIDTISTSKSSLCFGHFDIAGFEMYRGAVSNHGLDKNIFAGFDHVYTGHYHHVSTQGNITYLGSPCQLTWADHGDDRGFFVFDSTHQSTEFIKNPYDNFHKIIYNDDDIKIDDISKIDFSVYTDTFVKVIVRKKEDLYLFDKFIESLDKVGAIAHTVDDTISKQADLTEEEIIENSDISTILSRIIAKNTSNEDDKKELLNYMIGLYTKASNTKQV